MLIGAVVIVPIGLAEAGAQLFSPAILPAALARRAAVERASLFARNVRHAPVADAHRRRAHELGSGARRSVRAVCFSARRLSWIQWAAIASVMAASAGSAATSRDSVPQLLPD